MVFFWSVWLIHKRAYALQVIYRCRFAACRYMVPMHGVTCRWSTEPRATPPRASTHNTHVSGIFRISQGRGHFPAKKRIWSLVTAILSLNGAKNYPKIVTKITAVRPKGGPSHKGPLLNTPLTHVHTHTHTHTHTHFYNTV